MAALETTQLLTELEPVVAENLDRHLKIADEWMPHEYVPWSLGRDFADLGGDPTRINPLAPAELVIDHSVIADVFGTADAFSRNVEIEYGRNRERSIAGLRRVSKPGLRVYAKSTNLPRVLGGLGVAIISTSNGLQTERQAHKNGVGGEVLAYVW